MRAISLSLFMLLALTACGTLPNDQPGCQGCGEEKYKKCEVSAADLAKIKRPGSEVPPMVARWVGRLYGEAHWVPNPSYTRCVSVIVTDAKSDGTVSVEHMTSAIPSPRHFTGKITGEVLSYGNANPSFLTYQEDGMVDFKLWLGPPYTLYEGKLTKVN